MTDQPPVMSGELKPCPFCGEAAELNDYTHKPVGAWVLSHKAKSQCLLRLAESFHSREAALTAWNTRTPSPEPVTAGEAGEIVGWPTHWIPLPTPPEAAG